MKMLIKLSMAALVVGIQTTALSSNNYEDLVAEGCRWVNINGHYASICEDDAQRLSKNPTHDIKLQLLRAGNAYYLVHGIIVKVLRMDNMTGMVEIQAPGLVPTLWISPNFLSKRPIVDAYSTIETPDGIGWTLSDSSLDVSMVEDGVKKQQSPASTPSAKDGNTQKY